MFVIFGLFTPFVDEVLHFIHIAVLTKPRIIVKFYIFQIASQSLAQTSTSSDVACRTCKCGKRWAVDMMRRNRMSDLEAPYRDSTFKKLFIVFQIFDSVVLIY